MCLLTVRHCRHDGRYANDAIVLFMRELSRNHTHPSEYEVKLFDGGHLSTKYHHHSPATVDIGSRNIIEAGRRLLREHVF
jgi:chemotaxis protein CheD